ncbi:G patch domain and ankyrin repeat-containing protein 1 [Amia ocellicauda]|uniref:G patch domain and ankyrin repeat-containing protein 1 n=1 Tax=Amia ocellicauda TaxID=2972642 RepID=UPI003463A190|nr:GPAN1 protein [Amia calva]
MALKGLIAFTPAQEEGGRLVTGGAVRKAVRKQGDGLSGEEAKLFYESLLQSEEGGRRPDKRGRVEKGKRKERVRPPQRPSAPPPPPVPAAQGRDGNRLLKCAQEGDLRGLRELLQKRGCDVNYQDGYFWTAVMCAAYAGQRGAVRYLLQQGAAWVGVVDTQGRDARDLAEEAGHSEVVRELEDYQGQPEPSAQTESVSNPESRWCDVCQAEYNDEEERHCSSTLHQFSLRRPPPTPHYCLPPSNVGFRLMVREGWDPGTGLGPQGVGCKQPVRTVLKRDQKGLGYGPACQPRVTHFRPRDPEAVQRVPSARTERVTTMNRRQERRKEERDRAWERNLRTYIDI